jgi:hypothetical protein
MSMVSDRLHRIRTRHTEFTSAHAQECARFNCSLSVELYLNLHLTDAGASQGSSGRMV